jgi:hypothetical protein
MATAEEVFRALNEKAGFEPDNENWTKNTFAWKDIVPGKVYIYFQTGTGKECDTPNFGFYHENLDKEDLYSLRIEFGNILGDTPDEEEGVVFIYIHDLEDRSVDWALKTLQELERRILYVLT